ncbi:MAG: hypothetical protein BWX72_01745 [Firmicutes bacterium ADurb.Bin080]|nr:MAG: hypothetical protein BWX72_01745 [Firmicutes bacterium ADurb.Bin080]
MPYSFSYLTNANCSWPGAGILMITYRPVGIYSPKKTDETSFSDNKVKSLYLLSITLIKKYFKKSLLKCFGLTKEFPYIYIF